MASTRPTGESLAAISNGLVRLHTQFYGKGPTKAKTHAVDDTIVSVLWNGFTTVEATLIDQGEGETVAAFRRTFQGAMESQFRQVVEEATGRTVIAYMSQVNVGPNVAVELFLLEPGSTPLPPGTVETDGGQPRDDGGSADQAE
jgi:uncharacterized protein YbcI